MEDFTPSGFVEIADITVKLGYENRGLRALAGLLLQGRISKAAQVSNWARQNLTTSKFAMRRPMHGSAAKFIVRPWQSGIEKLKPKLPSLSVTKKPRTKEVSNWPIRKLAELERQRMFSMIIIQLRALDARAGTRCSPD